MKKNLQRKFMAKRPAMAAYLTYPRGSMWWHESLVHILPSIRPPSFVSPLPTLPRSITTVLRCVRSDLNLIYKRDLHTSASLKRRTGLSLPGDIFVLRVRPGSYLAQAFAQAMR